MSSMNRAFALVLGLPILVGLVVYTFMMSGEPGFYVDYPTGLVCVGVPLALGLLRFGPRGMFGALRSLRCLVVEAGPEDWRPDNLEVFCALIWYVYLGGLFAFLVGWANLSRNAADPSKIGPGYAVMLIIPIYALLLAEFLLRPILGILKRAAAKAGHTGNIADRM